MSKITELLKPGARDQTVREYVTVVRELAMLANHRRRHPKDRSVTIDADLYQTLLETRKGLIEAWAKAARQTLPKEEAMKNG